jgi:uncharacterized protein YbaP (TraB family)
MSKSPGIQTLLLLFVLVYACPLSSSSQAQRVENSIFWQVSGKDLMQPSYLFGTFHLLGATYLDSLTVVGEKFNESKTLVGELLLDSTMTVKMMVAARMHETTLDKLLSPEDYKQTALWLKELSGYDLKMFNGMNPMTIQIFLMTMLQQKYFPPNGSADVPMDLYLQQDAKKKGKKLVGLESFDVQVNALFSQFSHQRQAEMLIEFVHQKDKAQDELLEMNKAYRLGDLKKLEDLLSAQTYTEKEARVLLDDRNKNWIDQLPSLMKEQQTFIAVGALHLSGKNGLINLLRAAGYTVTPVPSK